MAVIRRRYLFWLLKAYMKQWGKHFIVFFFLGLAIFFLLLKFSPVLFQMLPLQKKTIYGIAGTYTIDSIPSVIVEKIGKGLTRVEKNSVVKPDLSERWEIKNEGKTYVFHLRKNVFYSDGTPFTAKTINYSFSNVSIATPDDYTIVMSLKEPYAPFLVTVSKPIFYKGYIGVGEYVINTVDQSNGFLKSVQLRSTRDKLKSETYLFYPTSDAVKAAFSLGEITSALHLSDTNIKDISLLSFPNVKAEKHVDLKHLVTIFYNTQDPVLSDKKLRNGLSYSIPDSFKDGQRAYHPYPNTSQYFNAELAERKEDISHAKILLASAQESASASAGFKLRMKVMNKYKHIAEQLKKSWETVGVKLAIEEVDSIPQNFQIYLGDFNVPNDPDQYTIWHSDQRNNITRFKNLRIDKLLEVGRKTVDVSERIKIYNDFQKYLLDDSPASFLYFPYEYDLRRK